MKIVTAAACRTKLFYSVINILILSYFGISGRENTFVIG